MSNQMKTDMFIIGFYIGMTVGVILGICAWEWAKKEWEQDDNSKGL